MSDTTQFQKRRYFYYLISFLLVFNDSFAQYRENRALLIGISNYQHSEWRPNHNPLSSVNDIREIKQLLLQRGFTENNITTLTEDAATRDGILQALDKLIQNTPAGANVYFHFSGHGQQIYDRAPSLDETDGFDESIVPTDAPRKFDPALVNDEKHIRDDELNLRLGQLRKKIGPNGSLLALMDACHSGSSTRGNDSPEKIYRGTGDAYMPVGYQPNVGFNLNMETYEKVVSTTGLAPMMAFYACGPGELNAEATSQKLGSLTYAFMKAISVCDSSCSYLTLFEEMKFEMRKVAPGQRPQYDGDINGRLFNGSWKKPERFFLVDKPMSGSMGKKFVIRAGSLQGIAPGSRLAFYTRDTDTTKTTPLTLATVTEVRMNSSDVTIDAGNQVGIEALIKAWIYPLKIEPPFNIAVDLRKTDLPAFRAAVESNRFASIGGPESHLSTYFNSKKDSVIFKNKYGFVLGSAGLKNPDLLKAQTRRIMLKAAKAEFFRNLGYQKDPRFNSKLSLEPYSHKIVNSKPAIGDPISLSSIYDVSGNLRIPKNTFLKIKVEALYPNKKFNLYYALIDVTPDDSVQLLTNSKSSGLRPDDFVLEGKDLFAVIPFNLRVAEPYGTEYFILVTSPEPIDFSVLLGTRGSSSGFGTLFNELMSDGESVLTRGNSPNFDQIHVSVLPFEVVK